MTYANCLCLSLFLSAYSVCNCQELPTWIANPQTMYPPLQYLVAIGSGNNRQIAEQSAVANLSMIFESTIKAENTLIERYREISSASDKSFDHQSDLDKNITVSSSQTLFNVRFGESAVDAAGTTYVVGFIERAPTADIYEERIQSNSEKILFFLKRYSESADKLEQYANISAASVISKVNEVLLNQLVVIAPAGMGKVDLDYKHSEVMRLLSESTRGISFGVKVEGVESDVVAGFAREAIGEQGFVVGGQEPSLSFAGSVTLEPIDLRSNVYFFRWSFRVELRDKSTNILNSLLDSGREGHVTAQEAKSRALRSMRDKIKSAVCTAITKYFDSLALK